ncbi:MAG: factor-independent urate hydroxylase [Pirellulaceae bacterium]
MSISVEKQSYGKSRVCLSFVKRNEHRHDFIQLAANIFLEGDFESAYSRGDNSQVIPTDTMKNTVYAMARNNGVPNIETFAQTLASHFYDSFAHVKTATVAVVQDLWQRMDFGGQTHDHAFTGGGSEQNTCRVVSSGDGLTMHSGLRGLQVLKTTASGFEGFLKDKFTTLMATGDRIFATTITADWPCPDIQHDWTTTRNTVRDRLLHVFAHQYSPSVQKTLHEMADSVLAVCPEIEQISLNMPNQHHLLADLEKLNLENQNDIFVPSPEPFGVISATIRRDG